MTDAERDAEVRTLRLTIAKLRAELAEARRHLNPPIEGPEATESEPMSPSGVVSGSRSPERSLYGSERSANLADGSERVPASSGASAAAEVPTLKAAEPVTVLPGVLVSPSVLRQRAHPVRVEDDGGDLDDNEEEIV